MKALRGALPEARRKLRAERAAERCASLPALLGAKLVATYVSVRGEIDTEPLEHRLREAGIHIAYPRVVEERVCFFTCERRELATGAMGIPEPPSNAQRASSIDAFIVPALALDPRGHRIGYGGGFYDRLLAEHVGIPTLGYAYDFQLIPEVADEPHDIPVEYIVTDERALDADGAS